MSVGGPRKTPTVISELHGSPGHRKKNRNEPRPGGNLFDPPAWMTSEQKAEWKYIVESSVPGLLTSVDRSNLTTFVVAVCLHRAAAIDLNKAKSLVVEVGENGALQQHPALQIVNRQALIILKSAAEMGFTPASRTRVSVVEIETPTGRSSSSKINSGDLAKFANENPDEKPSTH